jgi:hypothetical protein
MIAYSGTFKTRESCDQTMSMIACGAISTARDAYLTAGRNIRLAWNQPKSRYRNTRNG